MAWMGFVFFYATVRIQFDMLAVHLRIFTRQIEPVGGGGGGGVV